MRRGPWISIAVAAAVAIGARAACSPTHPNPEAETPREAASAGVDAEPALPGLGAPDRGLVDTLHAALVAKGASYRPRTRHLHHDGAPKYTNRLILETSPYLLQHAHNPVNWSAWGPEAFERARRADKPILLSVGYSTCHWCHVMEHESFEDEEIARFINEHFVPIKVDREERPDVDDVYMKAVQQLTGRGGWPMTVVMTPDKEPFFGGTYFPARDGDRGNGRGLLTILQELAREYGTSRASVVARARQISTRLQSAAQPLAPGPAPGLELLHGAFRGLSSTFDAVQGGFGRAPKFPRPVTLEFLLRYHRRTGSADARHMVLLTLQRMAEGGVYDHVGGGFHRYATDAAWLVPHFEKMLYDNAQLVCLYLAAYQLTGDPAHRRVARETLTYVAREMTAPSGAFYSATDADSRAPSGHEEEGYFFTWTPEEIDRALEAPAARLVTELYGVTTGGNFEHRNILHRTRAPSAVAGDLGLDLDAFEASSSAARQRLYDVRARRPPPLRDDKILTSWNGLMISALSRAALVLGDGDDLARARRAATFARERLTTEAHGVWRTYKDGHPSQDGYLDDYAFLIRGYLDLFEATGEVDWLTEARALQRTLDARFWDATSGGYFMTGDQHEKLLLRDKPSYDGAEPSGNAVALSNLLRLATLSSDASVEQRLDQGLAAFSATLARAPTASPHLLSALEARRDSVVEVAIVSPTAGDHGELALRGVFRSVYLPNRVLVATTEEHIAGLAGSVPFVSGKTALRGRATVYVCERGRCELPTSDPAVFERQLRKVRRPLPAPD